MWCHRASLRIGIGAALVPLGPLVSDVRADYVFHDLYTLPQHVGSYGYSQVAAGGQAVGFDTGTTNHSHALLFGPAGAVDLTPSAFDFSTALGTDGTHQVGSGSGSATGGSTHALLWSGSAASVVDLNPTNLAGISESSAGGVGGGAQVGYASGTGTDNQHHGVLWRGAADSATDLHPAGFVGSLALATDGVHQVGRAWNTGTLADAHAILWNGTAASAIDLHPTTPGFTFSEAVGLGGGQQVGDGYGPATGGFGTSHALLWTGTAASIIDLNPTHLPGITSSWAVATNGSTQVGYGGTNPFEFHALAWSGTADSTIDLSSLLPADLRGQGVGAQAYAIDSQGNIYGLVMPEFSPAHVVEWAAVPEPGTAMLLALPTLLPRRRRIITDLSSPVRLAAPLAIGEGPERARVSS